jgi:hypothetical protein
MMKSSEYGVQSLEFRNQSAKFVFLLFAFLIINFALAIYARAQIAAGGTYVLEKSVTAGGGASGAGASAGGNFTIEGTIGQFAISAASQNAQYNFKPGFWTAAPLAPTAAAVNLGGRAVTKYGGIANVRVTLTMPGGETRHALTNGFGYYVFAGVPVGETYIVTVYSKRFSFTNPTQIVSLQDAREDVDFIAEEN